MKLQKKIILLFVVLAVLLMAAHSIESSFEPSPRIKPPRKPRGTVIVPGAVKESNPAKCRAGKMRKPSAVNPVLILYDFQNGDTYKKLGYVYSIMLSDLLGHFNLTADLLPIDQYTAGKVEGYSAIFYFGSSYDNPISKDFLRDVSVTQKKIIWFKYNLWQLAWDPTYSFNQKFGFNFVDLRGLNSDPTPTQPNPGFFDTVIYKSKSMVKYYNYDTATDQVHADPDIGFTQILDPAKAKSIALVRNSKTGEETSYIIQAQNFWYVADNPFTYLGPRDRYLVFCDVLHDILGIPHREVHRALVRLEDVGANVVPSTMRQLTDYLRSRKIPFSVSAIPFYKDPLGYYNNGVPEEIHLANATDLLSSLRYASSRGGVILMHGYTHQYDAVKNSLTGVSGDDFEFWNAVLNSPVTEDSEAWATGRINLGLSELIGSKFSVQAFVVPHYKASPSGYLAFAKKFQTNYHRVVYYTSDKPNLDPTNPNRDFEAGMFFPYEIQKDYYGQRLIPENLGNIEYDISAIDPNSNVVYTWQDLLTNAEYAKVVRDGYASFFFHPFWLEPSVGVPGFQDFKNLVSGITSLGYSWISPSQVF